MSYRGVIPTPWGDGRTFASLQRHRQRVVVVGAVLVLAGVDLLGGEGPLGLPAGGGGGGAGARVQGPGQQRRHAAQSTAHLGDHSDGGATFCWTAGRADVGLGFFFFFIIKKRYDQFYYLFFYQDKASFFYSV